MKETEQKDTKSITAGPILGWMVGVLVIIVAIFGKSIPAILGGIVLLPITASFHKNRFNWNLSGGARVLIAVILVIVGMVAGSSTAEVRDEVVAPKTESAYDVPALIGMNLSQAREVLGTPSWDMPPNDRQLQSGTTEWDVTWENERGSLMITYDIKTEAIKEFFVSGDGTSAFTNTDEILAIGNLSMDDDHYTVKFVKALNAEGYTGAIVIPK